MGGDDSRQEREDMGCKLDILSRVNSGFLMMWVMVVSLSDWVTEPKLREELINGAKPAS